VSEAKAEGGTVVVSARVPAETAAELAQLAHDGDRSVSREVARAVRRHVEHEQLTLAQEPPAEPGYDSSRAEIPY
jgi:hypothetical protein